MKQIINIYYEAGTSKINVFVFYNTKQRRKKIFNAEKCDLLDKVKVF